MIKGMMGPERGPKAAFASAKGAQATRRKHGRLKITKLPTSVEELHEMLPDEKVEQPEERKQRCRV